MENQVKDVKSSLTSVNNRVAHVEEKMNVVAKGWTFLGEGIYGTRDDAKVIKFGTTLQECVKIYAEGK